MGDERISKHCELDEEDGEMKIMNYRAFERCYTDIMRTQPVTPKHVNKFYKQLDCLKQGYPLITMINSIINHFVIAQSKSNVNQITGVLPERLR